MPTDGYDQTRSSDHEGPIRDVSSRQGGLKPVIFAVDSGAESFARIEYGLRRRYANEYRVMCETSAMWGMKRLRDMKAAGEEVALILADQWMPDITGAEFLARAGQLFPTSKRAVLVEWGDRTTQEPVLGAMALGHIDYYANKPERPGDEYFHKMIAEFLYDWARCTGPSSQRCAWWASSGPPARTSSGTSSTATASCTNSSPRRPRRANSSSPALAEAPPGSPWWPSATGRCSKTPRTPTSPTPSASTVRWAGEGSTC
jgi:CheY-like chemotaxis protein